jgi:hypothetical protein
MLNSIIITNPLKCKNDKITYQFSLLFDKNTNTTIATLEINNTFNTKTVDNDLFINTLSNISKLLYLPYEYERKLYNGPEIKIKANDDYRYIVWSNCNNYNCMGNNSLNDNITYINNIQQKTYIEVAEYLINLSVVLFK